MNTFKTALTWGFREWKAGRWTLIFLALTLAISAFTAEYFLNQKFKKMLFTEASKTLGADLVMTSHAPIPQIFMLQAQQQHLTASPLMLFRTMLSSGDKLQLASVEATTLPPRHKIWADMQLIHLLSLKNNDVVQIGASHFMLEKTLGQDVENPVTLSFAPRLMMNIEDVPETQTILPGSLVEYRLLINGAEPNVKKYRQWANTQLTHGQRFLEIPTNTPGFTILQRANLFLGLSIIICLIIAGVTFIFGIQHYLREQQPFSALLHALGTRKNQIQKILCWKLLFLSVIGSITGIVIGLGLEHAGLYFLSRWINFSLLSLSYLPLIGIMSVSIFLCLSALVSLRGQVLIYAFTSIFLFWIILENIFFTLQFLLIFMLAIGIFYGLLQILYSIFEQLSSFLKGPIRSGIVSLTYHANTASLQIISFSVIIMAVLLLYQVRTDLFSTWQSELPPQTPNYFAINILSPQVEPFKNILTLNNISDPKLYPMVRGRLIELNQKPILSAVPASAKNNNALSRELNLSFMQTYPSDDRVVKGKPWGNAAQGKPYISIEKNLADTLGIKMNDTLTFQIEGAKLTGTVTNFRTLNWSSFHPNFYIIFSPGVLENFPVTYITSFYVDPRKTDLINSLSKKFPNILLIDVSSILAQVKLFLTQSTQFMQYAFLLSLIGGILLLITSLKITLKSRQQYYQLMRILGASKAYLQKTLLIEFSLSGLMAGTLGACLSLAMAASIAHYWLKIEYAPHWTLLLWGILLGCSTLTLPALFFLKRQITLLRS